MPEGFADGGEDEGQAFADGAGIAREIDEERPPAGARGGAREDRGGHFGKGLHAHDFAEAGQLALQHGARGLGRDVTRRRAGAAGGKHEGAVLGVAQPAERGFDFRPLVGDEHSHPLRHLSAVLRPHALDLRPASVLVNARARPVAQCHAGDLHSLRFSVTRISPMTICLSTALHMS